MSEALALAMFIALCGGLVRGLTGFGGSLVMMPALSLMFDPKLLVATVLLLEAFAAAPMFLDAVRRAHFRVIAPICAAAFVTVPLGGYVLFHTDPQVIRRSIAALVIIFSVMLLRNVRYTGARRLSTSLALGACSGVLLGGTGIGGPPIILYLLSGPDPIQVTRANLTLCVTAISVAALAMLWTRGALHLHGPASPLVLGPCYFSGILLGTLLFRYCNEQRFRQVTLLLLIAVSLFTLCS
jgi:uncharacterized membrane protein YfcA